MRQNRFQRRGQIVETGKQDSIRKMGASKEIKQGKRTNTKTVVQKNFLKLKKDLK